MIAPLVAVIVALALYPGLILDRGEAAVTDKIAAVTRRRASRQPERARGSTAFCFDASASGHFEPVGGVCPGYAGQTTANLPVRGDRSMSFLAPHIDYAGVSPIIALTAGTVLTLFAGLIGPPRTQRIVVSIFGLGTLAVDRGAADLAARRIQGPGRRRAAARRPLGLR